MLVVVAKGFLKLPNLLMLIKQKSLSKLGSSDFWQIANSVLNRGKPGIPPLFNGRELLFYDSVKVKLFAKNCLLEVALALRQLNPIRKKGP